MNIGRGEVWFLPFVEGQERRCLRGDFTLCVIRERGRHDGGGSTFIKCDLKGHVSFPRFHHHRGHVILARS